MSALSDIAPKNANRKTTLDAGYVSNMSFNQEPNKAPQKIIIQISVVA
jgi:hypothetical protein